MNCPACGQPLPPGADRCVTCQVVVPPSCNQCGQALPEGDEEQICRECATERIPLEEDTTDRDAGAPEHEVVLPDIHARFVGRLDVLQRLKNLFLKSRDEKTINVVTVVGDPGVGKSRLVLEFARSVRAAVPDTRVLGGTASAPALPHYAPIIHILAERFGISDSDPAEDARVKITHGVGEVMPDRLQVEVTHLLAHLMRVPFADSSVVEPLAQVPGQLEVRTYIAVRRFFEKDSTSGALLLYFDGVERAGSETVNLIHYLAEGLRGCPVCIIVTARPTLYRRHTQWGQGEFAHHGVELGPLNTLEAQTLFEELIHNREIPVELVEVARDRLGGVPRAIEELTRYLLEVGVLAPAQDGSWPIAEDRVAAISIPRTHEEILRARLRAMSPTERGVLERAAAVGEVFWVDAVVALVRSASMKEGDPDGPTLEQIGDAAKMTRGHVSGVLDKLCFKGLIAGCPDSTIAGEIEYRFAYPPIWDLAHELMQEQTRRWYHRLAAQWLELRPEGRLEQHQEQAARHLEFAGARVMAAARSRRAADGARSRFFNDKAILLYTRALANLGEADVASRIHLWHDLGSVYQLKGDLESALDSFERMLRLSWVVASKTKAAVAFNKMGRVWRQKGNLDLALEYLERGLDMFRQSNDLRGVATSLDDIGQSYWILGRYVEALDRSAKGLEMRRQLGDPRSIAASLSNIGNIEKSRGLFDEAESCYREAMQLRRSAGDRYGYITSLLNLGELAFERGDLEQARDSWEDALSEAESIGALPLQMILLNKIGEAAISMGKLPDARQHIEGAMTLATEIEDQRAYIDILLNLATIDLKEGNTAQASKYAHDCLELAERRQMRRKVGRSQMTLGEVAAATLFDESTPEVKLTAEDHFRRAIKTFRSMGNDVELARALRRLGEFQVERGLALQARTSLEEAAKIFGRLGLRAVEEVQETLEDLGLPTPAPAPAPAASPEPEGEPGTGQR
jgi:tetratricopeptide (TPR) repeat protein